MSSKTVPAVAIVGRTNVGKSTLFNRIVGKKISIVEDIAGVTRDRIFARAIWDTFEFDIIDTGGIEIYEKFSKVDEGNFLLEIKEQAELAMQIADIIIMVVDTKAGIHPLDLEVLNIIKRQNKPHVVACNKNDDFDNLDFYEFYSMGVESVIPISAIHGKGVGELLSLTISKMNFLKKNASKEEMINVSIVGKPNVGKSSLINYIVKENRTIVSDIAGTTRDSININFEKNGTNYNIIDTAGMRKKSKVDDSIEYYSIVRSLASIERSDICLLVIDATNEVSAQDERIMGYIHEQGRASLLVVNKWDLITKDTNTPKEYEERLRDAFAFIKYLEIIFTSAKTGQRVEKIFEKIDCIVSEFNKRISTGRLNLMLADAVERHQPPSDKGKRLKIYYMTQSSIKPPTFVLFINNRKLAHFSYIRYLENRIREEFGFSGTPIKIILREREK